MGEDADGRIERLAEEVDRLRRLVDRHEVLLQAQRVLVLRICAVGAAALIVLGLALQLFRTEYHGRSHRASVLTFGFQVLADPGDGSKAPAVVIAVGFFGLVVVALAAIWVLLASVTARAGRPRRRGLRRLVCVLGIVGSAVACLWSLAGALSTDPGNEGGWGGVVLLAALVAATVVIGYDGWADLWVDDPARRRGPGLDEADGERARVAPPRSG